LGKFKCLPETWAGIPPGGEPLGIATKNNSAIKGKSRSRQSGFLFFKHYSIGLNTHLLQCAIDI